MNTKLFEIHEYLGKHSYAPMVSIDDDTWYFCRCSCGHWAYNKVCYPSQIIPCGSNFNCDVVTGIMMTLRSADAKEFGEQLTKAGYSWHPGNPKDWKFRRMT